MAGVAAGATIRPDVGVSEAIGGRQTGETMCCNTGGEQSARPDGRGVGDLERLDIDRMPATLPFECDRNCDDAGTTPTTVLLAAAQDWTGKCVLVKLANNEDFGAIGTAPTPSIADCCKCTLTGDEALDEGSDGIDRTSTLPPPLGEADLPTLSSCEDVAVDRVEVHGDRTCAGLSDVRRLV